jgi:hypothetical protein
VERAGDESFTILGNTRGVYLEGYGAVFSSEVDLMASAATSPFRPEYTKAEVAKIKQKKQAKLDVLRAQMKEMLIHSAGALVDVPMNEQIVLAVSIAYFRWEDKAGMPQQIVMQAPRKALLTAPRTAQDAAIKVQEY